MDKSIINLKNTGLLLLILSSILTQSEIIATPIAYVMVAFSYLFVTLLYIRSNTKLQIPLWGLYFLSTISVIYLIHLILPVFTDAPMSIGILVRPPVFILFAIINLFYITRIMPPARFYRWISYISACIILIGLPTLHSDYQILIFEVSSRGTIGVLGSEVRRLASIFRNPNAAGYFYMIGTLVAIVNYSKHRNKFVGVILLINLLGLFLANNRSAYLGTTIAIGALLVPRITNEKVTRFSIWGGGLLTGIGVLMVANVLPQLGFLRAIDFAGRSILWEGGVQAFQQSPLLGYGTQSSSSIIKPYVTGEFSGAGIHSSYIRLFLSTGIIGGLLYVFFVIFSVISPIQKNMAPSDLIIFAVAIAVSFKSVFDGNTMFGISMVSVLTSITYGYAIQASVNPIGSKDGPASFNE